MAGFKTPNTRVKLGSPSSRSALHMIAVVPFALLSIYGFLTVGSVIFFQDVPVDALLFVVFVVGGVAAAMAWLAWVWGRGICFPGAWIELDAGRVQIKDASTLDAPITLDISDLMLVTVDEPQLMPAGYRLPVFRRFHWPGSPTGVGEQIAGGLVTPAGTIGVEVTSGAEEVNCALLFRRLQRVSGHKRHGLLARRRDIEAMTGVLLLSAADLDQLKYVFAHAGLLRRLSTDELATVPAMAPVAPPQPAAPAISSSIA